MHIYDTYGTRFAAHLDPDEGLTLYFKQQGRAPLSPALTRIYSFAASTASRNCCFVMLLLPGGAGSCDRAISTCAGAKLGGGLLLSCCTRACSRCLPASNAARKDVGSLLLLLLLWPLLLLLLLTLVVSSSRCTQQIM